MTALVQQAGAMDAVTPFVPSVTLPGVVAGNALCVACFAVATTASFDVTDDKGNTWVRGVAKQQSSSFCEIWYALNVAVGSTVITVTATLTGGVDSAVFAAELAPTAGSVFALVESNSKTNTAAILHGTGTLVPSAQSALFGAWQSGGGSPTITAASGFTQLTAQTGGNYYRAAYKFASSGSQEAQWDTTSTQTTGGAIILLREAAAGADVTPPTVTSRSVNGASLDITYNEALLTTAAPATGSFAVQVNSVARTVSSVSFPSATVVRLTLASAVVAGDTVTVAYTNSTNRIRDAASNNAADFTAAAVTNSTAGGVALGARSSLDVIDGVALGAKLNTVTVGGTALGLIGNTTTVAVSGGDSGGSESGIGNKGFSLNLFTSSGDSPAGWRPFDDTTSPLNKPVPANPVLATVGNNGKTSAQMVAKMVSWGNPADEYIGAGGVTGESGGNDDFNHPLYFSKNTDPLFDIQPTTGGDTGGAAYSGWSHLYGSQIRIPAEARGANGSDAHICVIDFENGYVWDMYHFQMNLATRKVPTGGGTVKAKACTRMSLLGTGWAAANTGTEGVISDAAGLSGVGGAYRPEEVAAGLIDHALALVLNSTDGTYVAPGSGTAASGDPTNAPPDGARVYLAMTVGEIDALNCSAWNKVLYKAFAKYGAYVRDTGSSSWSLQSSSSVSWLSQGQADKWHTWAAGKLYAYQCFYLWQTHDPTDRPDWATKLRVLDWTDPANR